MIKTIDDSIARCPRKEQFLGGQDDEEKAFDRNLVGPAVPMPSALFRCLHQRGGCSLPPLVGERFARAVSLLCMRVPAAAGRHSRIGWARPDTPLRADEASPACPALLDFRRFRWLSIRRTPHCGTGLAGRRTVLQSMQSDVSLCCDRNRHAWRYCCSIADCYCALWERPSAAPMLSAHTAESAFCTAAGR